MTLAPEQIALRRTGITATDIAAIVGEDPYRSPIDVWADKMGEAHPVADNEAMAAGREMEAFLCDWYASAYGVRALNQGTCIHLQHDTHIATPDRLVYREYDNDPTHGLEAKAHGWRMLGQYGEPGTDHVPRRELLQCAWGMHVCDLRRWDLVRLDVPPAVYTIHRDMELEEMLCEEADRFWRDFVVTRTPPQPDGTARYSEWLARRYPRSTGAVMHADAHLAELAQRLRHARDEASRWADEEERIAQEIQSRMGEVAVLDLGDGKIRWNTCAGKTTWKDVAEAMASRLGAHDLLEALAKEHKSAPSRRFSVPRSWGKKKEDDNG